MATVYINTDTKVVCDRNGNPIVDTDKLDDLTKAFLDAWNCGDEDSD